MWYKSGPALKNGVKGIAKLGKSGATECLHEFNNQFTIRFFCDENGDGVHNDNEKNDDRIGPCNKLKKLPKKKLAGMCRSNDEMAACPCEAHVQKALKGSNGAKYTCTKFSAKTPTWRVFCDNDKNDKFDQGELFADQRRKCRKINFAHFKC